MTYYGRKAFGIVPSAIPYVLSVTEARLVLIFGPVRIGT
jgi:hypothetical protein